MPGHISRPPAVIPASTTDNAIARYNGTTGALQNSAATVEDTTGAIKAGNFSSTGFITIADDAVHTLTISNYIGLDIQAYALLASSVGGTSTHGFFSFITQTTNTPSALASAMVSTDVDFAGVVLTGTTGANDKLTISVVSGVMYLENRLGGSRVFKLVFFGG